MKKHGILNARLAHVIAAQGHSDRLVVCDCGLPIPRCAQVVDLALTQNIPLAAAQAQVQASDRARRNYLRRYYQARWDDPELYDLIINTARLTPESAADLICRALRQLQQAQEPPPQQKEPS